MIDPHVLVRVTWSEPAGNASISGSSYDPTVISVRRRDQSGSIWDMPRPHSVHPSTPANPSSSHAHFENKIASTKRTLHICFTAGIIFKFVREITLRCGRFAAREDLRPPPQIGRPLQLLANNQGLQAAAPKAAFPRSR